MDIIAGSLLVLVLVLAFVVGVLASLVRSLALKMIDIGESKHFERVIATRRQSDVPEVFQDEPEEPEEPHRARTAPRDPRDLWQKVSSGIGDS